VRVFTQIVAGYLVAVATVIVVTALAYARVQSVGADLREIAEEWREMEAVSAALSAMRHDGTGRSRELLRAGDRKAAAEALGISLRTLYYRLANYRDEEEPA